MTEARPLPSYTRADRAYSLFETDHDPAFPAAVDQTTTFDHTCMNARVCQEQTSRMRPSQGSGYDRQI